jgi:Domain of unknown function (DUF4823)
MRHMIIASLALLGLCGCADTTQLVRQPGVNTVKLAPNDSIYVALPRDGAYGDEIYQGSGLTTAQTILSSFAKRARRAEIAQTFQPYDAVLATARNIVAKYLVNPTILHWENRATEWNGIPDRIEVKIEVIDVPTDSTAASVIIKGKSGLATLGGDNPQDLLPKPVEEFVSGLY